MSDTRQQEDVEFGKRVVDLPENTRDWPEWARERFVRQSPLGDMVLLGEYIKATAALRKEDPAYLDRACVHSMRSRGLSKEKIASRMGVKARALTLEEEAASLRRSPGGPRPPPGRDGDDVGRE